MEGDAALSNLRVKSIIVCLVNLEVWKWRR